MRQARPTGKAMPFPAAAALAAALALAGIAMAAPGQAQGGFANHGVAAPVARSRGRAGTVDGDGRAVALSWMMDHRGCYGMLVVDLEAGRSEVVALPQGPGDSPFAVLLSGANRFYSLFGGRFVGFDPASREFTLAEPVGDRVAMSFAEAPDGTVWAATYPNAHLVAYRPETGELTDYGPVHEEPWPQYPRTLAVDDEGWVYAGIGNVRSHLVAFNPATGEKRAIATEGERKHGRGVAWRGTDGQVYARPHHEGGWRVLNAGVAAPIGEPPVRPAPTRSGAQGALIQALPAGQRIRTFDVPGRTLLVADAQGQARRINFDYETEGCTIHSIVLGPDGNIHGSTGHPLCWFTFDPEEGAFKGHWRLKGYAGHLNALAVQGGLVYGGRYTRGSLYAYDPSRPWDDRAEENPNPWLAAQARAADLNRPHALLAHPGGELVLAGTPGYGRVGGGILFYDPRTDGAEMLSHKEILPNHSTMALIALPDGNLLGGTTVRPGTGGESLAHEAELYIMDFAERKVLWHGPPVPGAASVADLVLGPDGLAYGLTGGPQATFFAFDHQARETVHVEAMEGHGRAAGGQAPRIMAIGSDGLIYALFVKAIVRFEPGTFRHELLAEPPVPIRAGILLHEGRLYFTHGSRLWSWDAVSREP